MNLGVPDQYCHPLDLLNHRQRHPRNHHYLLRIRNHQCLYRAVEKSDLKHRHRRPRVESYISRLKYIAPSVLYMHIYLIYSHRLLTYRSWLFLLLVQPCEHPLSFLKNVDTVSNGKFSEPDRRFISACNSHTSLG